MGLAPRKRERREREKRRHGMRVVSVVVVVVVAFPLADSLGQKRALRLFTFHRPEHLGERNNTLASQPFRAFSSIRWPHFLSS